MVDYPEDAPIPNRNSRGGRVLGEFTEVSSQDANEKRRAEFYLDPGPNQ